jgi:hypothetical protein
LGKNPKHGSSSASRNERPTDSRGTKETFAADESSLGGKKESRRDEKGLNQQERHTYSCRPKKALRADEGTLGSKKKGQREIAAAVELSSCWECRETFGLE